jgi:SAM-dependent methyltransferase
MIWAMLLRPLYELLYLLRRAPWDTGVSPPELVSAVEGPEAVPAGRALDLGCGTGTNVVYLARHGWDATGVEQVGRALREARRRAAAAGVQPTLLQGDVTRLGELGLEPGFGLLFDLGCYHGIAEDRRDAYAAGATELAAPGATFLLYGFAPGAGRFRRLMVGTSADELRRRFTGWELTEATRGTEPVETWWYRLRRLNPFPPPGGGPGWGGIVFR